MQHDSELQKGCVQTTTTVGREIQYGALLCCSQVKFSTKQFYERPAGTLPVKHILTLVTRYIIWNNVRGERESCSLSSFLSYYNSLVLNQLQRNVPAYFGAAPMLFPRTLFNRGGCLFRRNLGNSNIGEILEPAGFNEKPDF